MSDTQPLAYLITSSAIALESYELSRLNRASNLRKEVLELIDRWVDAEIEARMAREVLQWRRSQRDNSTSIVPKVDRFLGNSNDSNSAGQLQLTASRSGSLVPAVNVQQKMLTADICAVGLRWERRKWIRVRRLASSRRSRPAGPTNFRVFDRRMLRGVSLSGRSVA